MSHCASPEVNISPVFADEPVVDALLAHVYHVGILAGFDEHVLVFDGNRDDSGHLHVRGHDSTVDGERGGPLADKLAGEWSPRILRCCPYCRHRRFL